MKDKIWIIGWLTICSALLAIAGVGVYRVDPFFHYHKPDTNRYFYALDNQRSQNDGIGKYFDYDAIITGTSMTENFSKTEFDEIFGVNSVKMCFAGGRYKEINDNLRVALKHNDKVKVVVRGLDTFMFLETADAERTDLGTYPTYLYDDNPFNDVNYVFNKDILFSRVYPMAKASKDEGFAPGITSFDDYSRWQEAYTFGINAVAPEGVAFAGPGEAIHLMEEYKPVISENVVQNITSLADEYPDVDFYYFFTPYCVLFYKELVAQGNLYQQLEAEQYIIELILEHDNIKLFSFSDEERIVSDINNYKDLMHYASWINSYMLRAMHDDKNRLTKDNYQDYLGREYELFLNFDYESLNDQEDYQDDNYAETLIKDYYF